MSTGTKPACYMKPLPCCKREDSVRRCGRRENCRHNIPMLSRLSTYWRKQLRNRTSKRRFHGGSKLRGCVQKIRTVSLILFPRRCALESSISREKRSIRFLPRTVTGPPFTLLQAGWLVPKETLPNKKNNSPLP